MSQLRIGNGCLNQELMLIEQLLCYYIEGFWLNVKNTDLGFEFGFLSKHALVRDKNISAVLQMIMLLVSQRPSTEYNGSHIHYNCLR